MEREEMLLIVCRNLYKRHNNPKHINPISSLINIYAPYSYKTLEIMYFIPSVCQFLLIPHQAVVQGKAIHDIHSLIPSSLLTSRAVLR